MALLCQQRSFWWLRRAGQATAPGMRSSWEREMFDKFRSQSRAAMFAATMASRSSQGQRCGGRETREHFEEKGIQKEIQKVTNLSPPSPLKDKEYSVFPSFSRAVPHQFFMQS